MSTTIEWKDASDELPDDDMTVLVALADGEVWTGFLDAGRWCYTSGDPIYNPVRYWADFPDPPTS